MSRPIPLSPGPFGLLLGQASTPTPETVPALEVEPIEVDRETADATKVAILRISEAAAQDKGVTLEPCWRVIRISKWPRVTALKNKLDTFLNSADAAVVITEAEFKLMDEILACALRLEEGEGEQLKSTLETVGLVVGIAGGLATFLAAVL